jgi:hypothetical protein
MNPEVTTMKDLITVAVLCLTPSLAWLTLCYNWYTKFDEIRATRRRTLASISEEVKHILNWTGEGYTKASVSLNWYNPTFGVLPFPSEKVHEFNAVPEPDHYGQVTVDALVALEASIHRFRALVGQPQQWASSAPLETRKNIMATMEFEPAGRIGWQVKAIKEDAVEALSDFDRQWRQELYKRNRDIHVSGIGNASTPEGLFFTVHQADSALAIVADGLKHPIRPKRFLIGHVLAATVGTIGVIFLALFVYGAVANAKTIADSTHALQRVPPALSVARQDSLSPVRPIGQPQLRKPDRPPTKTERSGLTLTEHVFLLFLGVVVGAAFGGAQKWAGYTIDRNRRHHRAVAQLEFNLGRQYHRLAMNASRAERLRDTLRAGELGSMFPALHRPDDSPCIELLSVGVINAVLRVNEKLEVLDHNVDSLRAAYEKVRDDFASNPTNEALRDAYERNAGPIATEYDNLRQWMLETRTQLAHLLATLRIMGQRDKPGIRRFLSGRSRIASTVTEKEVQQVMAEMALDTEKAAAANVAAEEEVQS